MGWARLARLGLYGYAGLVFVDSYVGTFVLLEGPSMQPTLREGDIVWASRLGPDRRPNKGDIVIATDPAQPQKGLICKRVTGVGGDVTEGAFDNFILKDRELWLEGDNAAESEDSRLFGPVPLPLVQGRLACRLLPPSRFTVFPNKPMKSMSDLPPDVAAVFHK